MDASMGILNLERGFEGGGAVGLGVDTDSIEEVVVDEGGFVVVAVVSVGEDGA